MRILLLCLLHYVQSKSDWKINLQYSTSAIDDFISLGTITVERTFDGNFLAFFQSSVNATKWRDDVVEAAKNGCFYRVRANINNGYVQGYSEPCLMLRARGVHHFRLSMEPDRQSLQSVTVFPENLFFVGSDYQTCETESYSVESRIRGTVAVNTIKELPLPDTVSYIQKMEKERQARQHGAQQDNRSFMQKYWMYIAAAVIFMIVSNAATGEQGGE